MFFLRLLSPGRLILVATLLVAAYLTFSAGSNVMHSFRLASDEERLRGEVDALVQDKQQLQQIRDYLRTDEYIEFMARRVFGLVKPGESLVIVDAPEQAPVEPRPGQKWWERLFSRPPAD